MLFKPRTNKASKRGLYGVVTSSGASGPWMRRLSFPVQTNKSSAVNWRHVFLTTKQNWLAAGPDGVDYVFTNGIAPQQAWALEAAFYFGILEAGLNEGGVISMARLIGCASEAAYYTMAQANRTSLGLSALPTPAIVSMFLSLSVDVDPGTVGNFYVTITLESSPSSPVPALVMDFTFTTTSQSDPPFDLSATGSTLSADVSALMTTQSPGTVFSDLACNVIANGTNWNYTFSPPSNFGDLRGYLLTVTGFDITDFNVTNAVIVANTIASVSIAEVSIPATLDIGGSGTISNTSIYTYTGKITIEATNSTVPGDISVSFLFSDDLGTHTIGFIVAASSGTPTVAAPPPVFAFPSEMSCATDYDTSYAVIGFFLKYSWVETWTFPASPWVWNGTGWSGAIGRNSPGIWEIVASDQYSNSYSPPDASTWKPILFSGPYMPSAAAVLAAWIALYGELKTSGNIKFQASYIDPSTGASGPALSATAGWEAGTLKGADLRVFVGPHFETVNLNPGESDASPGGAVLTMSVQALYNYGGTITFTGENSYKLPNGPPPGSTTLPEGTVITLTPATLTITAGDTSLHTVTATFVLPSTTPNYELNLKIVAKDGKQTSGISNVIQIVEGTGNLLTWYYLTIDPGNAAVTCPNPGNAIVTLTLNNTGADALDVTMSASADHDDVTLEFGTFTARNATATSSSITFDFPNSEVTNGLINQTISSAGYAPAGYNVTDATIIASDSLTVTVAASANPGAMTVQGKVGFAGTALTVPAGSMTTPGAATIDLLISLPGNFPSTGIQIQITANCGIYTAYSGAVLY